MNAFPPVLIETIKRMAAEARVRLDELDRALTNDSDIGVRIALGNVRVPLEVAAKFVAEEEAQAERRESLCNLYERRRAASGEY